ncbi:MAG: CHAD domain-containing protein [Azospirillum sp.]|nr:CHAD domain-containing protein [Azospirillum sp.]
MTALPSNTETELKLRVRPEDLQRLRGAPVLTARASGRAATQALESVYFDTEDFGLYRRLVTLRVRKKGQNFIQTIKTAGDASRLLARDEWEWPVAGAAPDLSVVVEPEALAQLDGIAADQLRPVFASHIKRTVRMLDDGAVELAIDTGEIRAGDVAVAVCEVELELKKGEPAHLFELAAALTAVAPLRFETQSKAERGYALAQGRLDSFAKAGRVTLEPDCTAEDALARILRSCLAQLLGNETCAVKGADPEGIHQMRVAIRRMRSALSVFRSLLPLEQYAGLVEEIRWLAAALGPARDWDVFHDELLAPARLAFAEVPDSAEDLKALAIAAKTQRERGYAEARAAILSPRYTALVLTLARWLETRGWRGQPVTAESARLFNPVTALADRLLARRHKRARKAGAELASLSAEQRHRLRIALKKLRYAVEFFRTLYDEKSVRRYLERLTELQDALGHLNDVATAARLLSTLHQGSALHAAGEPRGAGIVIGWHGRGLVELEPRLIADWHAFLGVKPFWSKPGRTA